MTTSAVHPHTARAEQGNNVVDLDALRLECVKMMRKRALLGAASSLIPIPGVDLLTDITLMLNLIGEINQRFGLSEAQIENYSKTRKVLAYKLLVTGGGMLASRLGMTSLVVGVLRIAGGRLLAMEASRLVPIAGQIVAAAIGYWAMTSLVSRHIEACVQVSARLRETPAA
ncbi:MAG: hypothetical protein PHY62_03125 [Gallionella sp.]|nr:hypothetical protein [Gallionella sp.]